MTEKLIPLLRNIKTKEPSVTMGSLAVYAEMGKSLGHEVVASEILPALWPMTVGVLLNVEQVLLYVDSADMKFDSLLVVIRELENKVIQQQTQKLHELGPSLMAKEPSQQNQHNSPFGPMEEITLDFESLVLGKKSAPMSSPGQMTAPVMAIKPQPVKPQPIPQQVPSFAPPATTIKHMTTQPMNFMTPLQPTTQSTPLPSSNTILQPLKPFPYTATTATPNVGSLTPQLGARNGMFVPPSAGFNVSGSNMTPGLTANPWSSNLTSQFSLPTIAPPPAKTNIAVNQPQAGAAQNGGLEKYQSLL
jgi:SCY1-like protein 2